MTYFLLYVGGVLCGLLGGLLMAWRAGHGHPFWPGCAHQESRGAGATEVRCADCGARKTGYLHSWTGWYDGKESVVATAIYLLMGFVGAASMMGLVFGP